AVLVELRQPLAWLTIDRGVEQHHRVGRSVVPEIVMNLLVMPAVLPGPGIEREHRGAEKIVPRTHGAVEIRGRIVSGDVQETQLRIERGRLPDRGTSAFPRVVVGGPGFVTRLARTGNGVEDPTQLAGLGVEGLEPPSSCQLTTRVTDDDQ